CLELQRPASRPSHPCPASHRISTKPRFIPEIDLRAIAFGRSHNARIRVPLPSRDRCRIALIGAHQWLLWCQPQVGEQLADRGAAERDPEPIGNQLGDNETRPQAKIKAVLAGVLAVDPTKYLTLLRAR